MFKLANGLSVLVAARLSVLAGQAAKLGNTVIQYISHVSLPSTCVPVYIKSNIILSANMSEASLASQYQPHSILSTLLKKMGRSRPE